MSTLIEVLLENERRPLPTRMRMLRSASRGRKSIAGTREWRRARQMHKALRPARGFEVWGKVKGQNFTLKLLGKV